MAEVTSVCISPDCSAPVSFREGSPGRGSSTTSSSVLAGQSVVYEPDVSPGRLSIGDSNPEGSSVSSTIYHPDRRYGN